jgi:REP element-mobilizing transposase RayT
MHCEVLALGGDSDHIHLLIRISTAISVAELVKEIKGSTSHLLNHLEPDKGFFKWQGAYGAFTVSENMLPTITAYITNQKKHHAENTIQTEIEQTFVVS